MKVLQLYYGQSTGCLQNVYWYLQVYMSTALLHMTTGSTNLLQTTAKSTAYYGLYRKFPILLMCQCHRHSNFALLKKKDSYMPRNVMAHNNQVCMGLGDSYHYYCYYMFTVAGVVCEISHHHVESTCNIFFWKEGSRC
jgi:hypothetical protein